MGYRLEEEQSSDRRIDALRRSPSGTLPAGFAFEQVFNEAGEPSLRIIHVESGRVVLEGF